MRFKSLNKNVQTISLNIHRPLNNHEMYSAYLTALGLVLNPQWNHGRRSVNNVAGPSTQPAADVCGPNLFKGSHHFLTALFNFKEN